MRDWDAATYDRVSDPQVAWAERLLERLELRGGETVLDAGCGSGRVTRMLLERLPEGRVVAVDQSASMVEHARRTLDPGNATVLCHDLLELSLEEAVDAVFSNAVFHWIPDHDRLFRRLHAALRPGGRLVAQCGGAGNVRRFHRVARQAADEAPFDDHLAGWSGPWHFATAETTAERLRAAGFVAVETWLEPSTVAPDDPRAYLRSVCLGHHLEALPAPLREPYVERVLELLGDGTGWRSERLGLAARRPPAPKLELDYVRLNITARASA